MYLISSWGSSGSGKTTVALALASAFAKRNADVLLLSAEMRTPLLPILLPSMTALTGSNSIGPLLTGELALTEASLKDKLIRHPKSSHVFCLGLVSGETAAMTYGPPVRDAAIKLFQILAQTPFRYVIVDCDSNPLYDQLSLAALEYAQTGLAVLTPDIKGYEFWKAQLSWLGTSDAIHMDQYLKIANPVGKYTLLQDARALFGGFAYELPYTPQAAEKMAAGELLTGLNTATAGVVFEQQISRLADQIEEAEHAGTANDTELIS